MHTMAGHKTALAAIRFDQPFEVDVYGIVHQFPNAPVSNPRAPIALSRHNDERIFHNESGWTLVDIEAKIFENDSTLEHWSRGITESLEQSILEMPGIYVIVEDQCADDNCRTGWRLFSYDYDRPDDCVLNDEGQCIECSFDCINNNEAHSEPCFDWRAHHALDQDFVEAKTTLVTF